MEYLAFKIIVERTREELYKPDIFGIDVKRLILVCRMLKYR
jgi:hypothetical protein